MKKLIRPLLLLCLLTAFVLLAASCGGGESPYRGYDEKGYTVSIRFDANGGNFHANTPVLVDSYSLADYQTNDNSKKEIKLFSPDDPIRGEQRSFTAGRPGYYLAGWYTQRTENEDGSYSYSGRWDFDLDRLELDPNAAYSSEEPVLTLYAAWIPDDQQFKYNFYTVDAEGHATLTGTKVVNPTGDTSILLPALNEKTGKMGDPNDFPALDGMTYDKVYADAALTQEITSASITHTGTFNKENATVSNPEMNIYSTTLEGLWFRVDSPEKLISNGFLNANFILEKDLDFTGKYWPTAFQSGSFTGSVHGNGHAIKNVTITQGSSSVVNYGLFGQITEKASLTDVTFDNITVKINEGSRANEPNFGILAGLISEKATVSGVTLKNSKFEISTALLKKTNIVNPTYGLVAGLGPVAGVSFTENNTVVFGTQGNVVYERLDDENGRFTLVEKTN